MPLKWKKDIDILQKLRDKGYNTNIIRTKKLLSESTVQKLRTGEGVAWANIETICRLLQCQPGDLMEYKPEE